jgi:hypothetical protein
MKASRTLPGKDTQRPPLASEAPDIGSAGFFGINIFQFIHRAQVAAPIGKVLPKDTLHRHRKTAETAFKNTRLAVFI